VFAHLTIAEFELMLKEEHVEHRQYEQFEEKQDDDFDAQRSREHCFIRYVAGHMLETSQPPCKKVGTSRLEAPLVRGRGRWGGIAAHSFLAGC
jgi:hypothetical protein